MFSVNKADEAIMKESHELITEASSEARKMPSSPGMILGKKSLAMIPYTFGSSDGLFNLGSALAFVQSMPPGIYIAMNGQCFDWDNVRKNLKTGFFEDLGKGSAV